MELCCDKKKPYISYIHIYRIVYLIFAFYLRIFVLQFVKAIPLVLYQPLFSALIDWLLILHYMQFWALRYSSQTNFFCFVLRNSCFKQLNLTTNTR